MKKFNLRLVCNEITPTVGYLGLMGRLMFVLELLGDKNEVLVYKDDTHDMQKLRHPIFVQPITFYMNEENQLQEISKGLQELAKMLDYFITHKEYKRLKKTKRIISL